MQQEATNVMTTMAQDSTISHPVAKGLSVWALVGVSSWTEAAGFLACIWTSLLICEWFWKKVFRSYARRRGWISAPPTDTEMGKL